MDALDLVEGLLELLPLAPIALILAAIGAGWAWGGARLRAQHRAIRERECSETRPATTAAWIDPTRPVDDATLAVGTVVVSMDAFRHLLGGLQRLVGGEVTPYTTLLDLARREALLRMYASQPRADAFVGCRIMTSSLEERASYVEVLATSTALRYERRG
ncbi:MAG: YbjQ family protein [Vicinamibacteria bacterium]|nr:YbjQ family protein [Vicinamibacteria bacterium]